MNAVLSEMGDDPVPAADRPWLPAPPMDWSKGVAARWGLADASMRSGDCALEFQIEKGGKGLAGAHFLVKMAPESGGALRTGWPVDTLFDDPTPGGFVGGGFGYGGGDRARTRYAVSDASGIVRFEKLPMIPVKIEVLVPTSNFPEAGRSWSLWMEVEPGVLKLASDSSGSVPRWPGIDASVSTVQLEEGKLVRYPRLVVTPAFEMNIGDWERVDKDTFELRWSGLDPAKGKDVRYELEMTLSGPAQSGSRNPVLQSAKETLAVTAWPVGQKGVGGMRLEPGNIYEFEVRAVDESGEVIAQWLPTPVWTAWPGRESEPPLHSSETASPIFHDIWWRGEFPGHLDTDTKIDEPLGRFLQQHPNAFEFDYVRVGKAWLTWCHTSEEEGRKQLAQLVRELPAGNVARGTAAWLLRQLDEGQEPPRNLGFVPDGSASR